MPKRPTPPDLAQRPMFDPHELARLQPAPAPSPGGPKPDPRQLTLSPADVRAARFNASVAAECEAHAATEHVTCPTCGDRMCLYWSDQSGDPRATCSNGHLLFPDAIRP